MISTDDIRKLISPDTKFGQDLLYIEGQTFVDARIVNCDLEVETNLGIYKLIAEGDCCSNSWFEAVEAVDLAKGHIITKFTNRDLPEVVSSNELSEIKVYGAEIQTLGGTCWFEMRNSSNGYYGGNWEVSFKLHPHLEDAAFVLTA